jgi:murein DD-endopeptidase MepM/ murein hydrolase activator NlpD
MTPLFVLKILGSLKTEFKIVAGVLGTLFFLPLIALVVIANAGVAEVASALVSTNTTTHEVEIKNANGEVTHVLKASTIWPVTGVITLEFGQSDLPYQVHHTGIDIANRHQLIGDPVTTFMEGKVIKVNTDLSNGCGNFVTIDHGDNITSLYCHLSVVLAHVGQEVKPGDIIGLEGSTGNSTGPHVHFQINVSGVPVNPRSFMIGNPDPGLL